MNQSNGTAGRTLYRARSERLVFGVCGGLAQYLGVDPTVVRVVTVLIGLLPPAMPMLLVAYVAMALIVPQEGAERLEGREQVRENLSSLREEVAGLAGTVRARLAGERSDVDPPAPVAQAGLGAAAAPAAPAAGKGTERPQP
jgi:phage shock protein C